MTDHSEDRPLYDVAIVGMAGRFPGAPDVRAFWENLKNGVESITFFSDEELRAAGVPEEHLAAPGYVRAGAPIEGAELFDAGFFGFSPREAEVLDPQQRLFLETAWQALEDAGHVPERFGGSIGVFAGTFMSTYLLSNLLANPDVVGAVGEIAVRHGNDKDYLATRTSYKLGLVGPSLTVQTSCSTSLVAVHLACQSLLNRECDMALAGGVSVRVPDRSGYFGEKGGVLSPDGRCRAFDARAGGTVFGDGVAIVALRRLEDALAAGDRIYAVIKGSAVNNDGSDKIGYTAPSLEGQARVIAEALAVADVSPDTISYVEAHGTGTALGDPIEIAALTRAWRELNRSRGDCAIGSVKTNVGHLSAASGVTGLIKTALMLHHGWLVPSLHFESPNPEIDFAASPFHVNTALREWKAGGGPLRAAVSSFGMGGTNAHAILEEAPPVPPAGEARRPRLLLVSARSAAALDAATANLASALAAEDLDLGGVARTLWEGRRTFPHRRTVLAWSREDAADALRTLDPRRVVSAVEEATGRPVVFLFPGQGAQYAGMGRGLYESEAVFRREIDRAAEALRPRLGLDLRDLLFPAPEAAEEAGRQLARTALTQPAVFAVEHALARLWMSWGVVPTAMTGHSIGEYVAACLAGVLAPEDALALVAERGRLMQALPGGSMLAVSLPEEEIVPLLGEGLALAAVNAPDACVVAGATAAVAALEERLAGREGVKLHRLETSHAFHSPMMEPVLDAFAGAVRRVPLHPPELPYVSNLTGTWITPGEATDPAYWTAHLRRTVRFGAGLDELLRDRGAVYLEVGPGRTLSSLVRRQKESAGDEIALTSLRHPRDVQEDLPFLLSTLGRLWLVGGRIDGSGFEEEGRRRVSLPTYPFERRRYWVDPRPGAARALAPARPARADFEDWFWLPVWKQARPLPPFAGDPEGEGTWLVCDEGLGLGAAVTARLREAGCDVEPVVPGAAGEAGLPALVRRLAAEGRAPRRIVHLWGCGPAPAEGDPLESARDLGFFSLTELARVLGRELPGRPVRILAVTSQAQEVTGGDLLHPERALALGACKVIPQEYPDLACRAVDLPETGLDEEERAALVLAEAAAEPAEGERTVAYRGRYRWVQAFEPVRLGGAPARLRERGVYLITGGMGGIGLALAGHLARSVKARLALAGRSPLPPREEWEARLASGEAEGALRARLEALLALERAGAEVLVLQADVADAEVLARAVERARERFGAIHGVLHAAGTAGGGVIQLRSREQAEKVLAPKTRGTLNLESCFRPDELDFFLAFSSTTAVTGRFGQVDYCAANCFLDAFAHAHRLGRRTFVASVNWATWREVGMAVDARAATGLEGGADAEEGIATAEGIAAFERILGDCLPRVAVTPRDLHTMIRERDAFRAGDALAKLAEAAPRPAHPRPVLSSAYVPPNHETERRLAALWQEVLGVEPVGIHDNFFELGGNSVTGLQLVARIAKQLAVELEVVSLYEAPTVAALAKLVARVEGDDEEAGPRRRERGERRRQKRGQRHEVDLGELEMELVE